MNEQIYEIPVNDAFNADTECPFCYMKNKLEKDSINFMLGPSYMEDDIRMETNKMGFCKDHYAMMYKEQNRLGLALMVHTHLQQINKDLNALMPKNGSPTIIKKGLFSKPMVGSNSVSSHIHAIGDSCYICNKIDKTFVNFVDTFFYLWKKDKKFVELVKNCKGFCLEHFSMIYENAPSKLSTSDCTEFYKIIIPIELENLKRVESELSWFIDKFDYRYFNEPWKNSKDALPRSIQKVSSTFVSE
jgi:hypothetical protein